MLQIRTKSIQSKFVYPFTTAYGEKTHQPALLIAISFNGVTGFGEAPAIHYYDVRVEDMIETLLAKIEMLQKYAYTPPERFWHFCHHLFPDHPFLVCALDMAYWDLYAKINRKKIYELFPTDLLADMDWQGTPLTDYTIGIADIETMLQIVHKHPMPIYKIKVGSSEDAEKLKIIRKHTRSVIRIDANASWSLEQALTLLPLLESLNIELIEQPFAKDRFEDTRILAEKTSIPVIADESCVSEQDVARCAGYFDGINIKLTKCAGITPALRMIQECRKRNLQIMMGCMSETEIGSYAIAQFLPLLNYVDMDGPLLLELPPLKLLRFDQARVSLI